MLKLTALVLVSVAALSAPVLAADAAAGEKGFAKCKSCHMVVAPDGTEIVKGGKIGPNLYGVIGRQIGSVEGFKYGDSTVAAGADGSVWDEAALATYLVDPTKWLKEKTGDSDAKSKMTFKMAKGGEDIAAYLASVK